MKKNYVAPEMEMLEVQIEKGFATSGANMPQPGGDVEIPGDL